MRGFILLCFAILLALTTLACNTVTASKTAFPDPALDAPLASTKGEQTAVLAGGCFWGVEAVFENVKGVTKVESGYSGGSAGTANYDTVSAGGTGHAEAVHITYDPSKVSYGQLLKVFFSVAHNPTELNRQGPDVGSEYRSAIFYSTEEQKRIAQAYITQLGQQKAFGRSIVTVVTALDSFYIAEDYHQDFAFKNPHNSYIVIHDLPKVENLRKRLPELYVKK